MTREELDAKRRENRRKDQMDTAIIDLIGGLFLDDPKLPEWRKIEIRLVREAKKMDTMLKSICDFAISLPDEERTKELYPLRREVLEYITLVNVGMEAFLQEHPVPEDLK